MSDTLTPEDIEAIKAQLVRTCPSYTIKDIYRLCDAALKGVEPGWRDIESAPKDTLVLTLWVGENAVTGGPVYIYVPAILEKETMVWINDESGDEIDEPHYWMPLPPPPTKQEVAVASEGEKSCTCHPDDTPPDPCVKQYAYSECSAFQRGFEACRELAKAEARKWCETASDRAAGVAQNILVSIDALTPNTDRENFKMHPEGWSAPQQEAVPVEPNRAYALGNSPAPAKGEDYIKDVCDRLFQSATFISDTVPGGSEWGNLRPNPEDELVEAVKNAIWPGYGISREAAAKAAIAVTKRALLEDLIAYGDELGGVESILVNTTVSDFAKQKRNLDLSGDPNSE